MWPSGTPQNRNLPTNCSYAQQAAGDTENAKAEDPSMAQGLHVRES